MQSSNLISVFMRHKVAANLTMLLMIVCGLWALTKLNIQFMPNFEINAVSINVVWPGANAEDVEQAITIPIEQQLRRLDYLKEMKSSSTSGNASINLEFEKSANINEMLEVVRDKVTQVKQLPEDSELPVITRAIPYDAIAKLVITGPMSIAELRTLAKKFERELLDRGISKIEINGLPELEMAIEVPSSTLTEIGKSLIEIGKQIDQQSQDIPVGEIFQQATAQQLRSIEQGRNIDHFNQIKLTDAKQQPKQLQDIATIQLRAREGEPQLFYRGNPAVELVLYRTEHANALSAAKIFHTWLTEVKPKYQEQIQLLTYDESWTYIKDRINLLISNGLSGLALILVILFLFLNYRIAFWIAVGIPTSLLAAMLPLYFFGSSINMISLFALIMTLGIIVDDTIVIGEESLSLLQQGLPLERAAEGSALNMFAPIMSSSLTTIAAFLPLMMISGIIGKILFDIPLVVICVIIVSIIECFLVLPGHLYHSLSKLENNRFNQLHDFINTKFNQFKQHQFRLWLTQALQHQTATLTTAVCMLVFSINLLLSHHVAFTFFPSIDGEVIYAKINFTSDTPEHTVNAFSQQVHDALLRTAKHYQQQNGKLIKVALHYQGMQTNDRGMAQTNKRQAEIIAALPAADHRLVSNDDFIRTWRANIALIPEVENLTISTPKSGPPGQDIDIELSGNTAPILKQAALALATKVASYAGVNNAQDDLPYGQEQLIFKLTPQGHWLGLTTSQIGQQLKSAFNGYISQLYYHDEDEIEVRTLLAAKERNSADILSYLPIITATGRAVPLANVAEFTTKPGLDILRHTDGILSTHVTAEVDSKVSNGNQILADLQTNYLDQLAQQYGIKYALKGRATEQLETMSDMRYGLGLAVVLIYIILSWIFASYSWPLLIMISIPFGLVGAILGHWLLGIDLTILSLFGIFGLSGIVINDSIILLCRYKELRQQYASTTEAIIESTCQRLRPVMLTSLTTIAGLTPLLFETSLQAQFLIPMATSIAFGLGFATVLILIVIPCLLAGYETILAILTVNRGYTDEQVNT